jgi:peptidyl-prolyl cis-trans isomerase SurA
MTDLHTLCGRALIAVAIAGAALHAAAQRGDYIVAVVNQELVTASEVQQRLARIREEAARSRTPLPPAPALRRQVLEALVDERVLVTNARESGARVDEPELDRAVANVAQQNQMTMAQLRERLRQEGMSYAKFRDNIRDQILVERVREREVVSRIRITDAEIDDLIEKRRKAAGISAEINVAQILVAVPEGASDAVVAERRARADAALRRIQGGEDFAAVARDVSEDTNRAQGGEIGLRPADRLPDLFVRAIERLKPGEVSPDVLRSGAGFHVVKLVERKESAGFTIDQARLRHILLRPSPELSPEAAARRLLQFKRDIQAGTKTFEQLARENSEDGSAAQGGDLGWTSPGSFVPEFEEAVAALPVGGISDPVTTRFGMHLVQVVDRRKVTLDNRQLREQARNILREQKFEEAFAEWLRDLRGRSYIEYREPPQ